MPFRLSTHLLAVAALLALLLVAAPAAGADQWFKTDTHVHSSAVSGDAPQDIGIISAEAKSQGFDTIFLTDHTAAGTQAIGGVTSNHPRFDDDITQWAQDNYPTSGTTSTTAATQQPVVGASSLSGGNTLLCELGAPQHTAAATISATPGNSTTNEVVAMPANTGSASLHLASTQSGYGETFGWLKRGPNLHSGDVTLKFAVNPTRIDPGSGLYVSMSIGGDETIPGRPPTGYTPQGGTPQIGKRNLLVWQLGNPRQDSSDPNARVITHQLPYMLGVWNTYTINVTQALNEIPAADRPSDLDALAMLKMSAAGRGGTAEGYFDTFAMDTSADMTQGQEFAYRNQRVHDYDTPSFKVYPGEEMGYNRHVQRFNQGSTDPAQFTVNKTGTNGVAATQATGYPTQMDHPGLPGGATQQEAIDSFGAGADAIEAAERGENGLNKNVMVDTWDGILERGAQILGAWSSDAHRPEKFGQATYLLSPSIGFDDLMRSYFEGRSYLGLADFTGRAIFNVDGSGANPYPARYPIWVSPSQSLARVHFRLSDGIAPGSHVIWTRNGDPVATDSVSGSSYDQTRSFSLAGPWTYVRAELRDSTDQRIAMSQPIFFRDTSATLAPGMSFNVQGVTTPSGAGYSKPLTQGLTSSSWDGAARQLTVGLTNPAGSLVELRYKTGAQDPATLSVAGALVAPAASRNDYDAATGSSWWYEPSTHTLLVKARQTGGTGTVVASFVPAADGTPPATPTGFVVHSAGSTHINLNWAASGGDVDGYTVYRDGNPIAITPADVTSFSDSGLAGGTRYTYTVDAFDVAENHSARSISRSATTDILATTTFTPVADAYVDESHPTSKYGSLTSLRIDGSPVIRSYLRFDVSGLSGSIERAQLRVLANSNSAGHDAHSASNSWAESTLTYGNAPPPSATVFGSTKGGGAGTWTTTDVTPMVAGNGTITVALDTQGTSAVNYASRESGNPPQLVIDTSTPVNDPPTADDRSLSTTDGVQQSWTPSVVDADGDNVTCSIVSQPAHGSASVAPDCSSGTYSPTPGYSGSDSFTYRATDSHGADSNVATVSATIDSNQAPSAADRSLTTAQDTAGSWTPSVSDPDSGDTITCSIVSQPAHGSATVASDCSSGSYAPAAGYSGPDSFTYKATDNHGRDSSAGTVSATVTSANQAPSAADRSLTTAQDTAGSWTPSVSDPDSGDTTTCSIVSQPAHGSATVASDCSSGSYTPSAGYTGSDSFTYRATDNHGTDSSPATVSATVNPSPVFADGFESGTLAAWTSSKGLTVQSATFKSGAQAARGAATNGVTWARKRLPGDYGEVRYQVAFRMDAAPTTTANVLKLRTGADGAIAAVFVTSARKLGFRNEFTGTSKTGTTTLATGQWYTVELRGVIDGAAGSDEVRLDGARLNDLSGTANLGVTRIGMVQLGENNTGPAYTFYFDDVAAFRGPGGGTTVTLAKRACAGEPRLRLSGARRQRLLKRGKLRVYARVSGACRINAVAQASVRAGKVKLRSKKVKRLLKPGGRRLLRLTFTSKARKRLRKALKRGPVKLTVAAREDGRPLVLASRKITVTR